MNESFVIRFERSGGFTGMAINKTIDSLQLKKEESDLLRQMIDGSDFFALPDGKARISHPDRFTYQITIETAKKKHTVQFNQASIPESLKDLIRYLIEKTRLKK